MDHFEEKLRQTAGQVPPVPLTTLRRIAATAKQAGFWGKIMIFATGANVSEYSMPYPWVKPLATRRALYRSSVPSE